MIDKKNITGIILAGGKSSRMGQDKGLLLLNEQPFIQHIIKALSGLVSEILIVSNNVNHDAFGLRRIEDCIENAGPLAGIYSGLNASQTKYNLVLSCDVPLITSHILKILVDEADDKHDIVQIESERRTMPLIAIYKESCKKLFYNLLKKGERRLQFAVNQCKVKTIRLNANYEKNVININTPDDLKTIKNDY